MCWKYKNVPKYLLVELACVENWPWRFLVPVSVVVCRITMVSIVALPAETSRPGKLFVADPKVVSCTNWSDVPACAVSKGSSL